MQVMLEVPSDIGEKLQKLSKPELIRALRLVVQNKQPHQETAKKQPRASIRDTPAFGMWADREDMEDPASYVRELRKPRTFSSAHDS